MELVFYLTLLLVASFSRGHESAMRREEEGRENENSNGDNLAFESFGAPVFDPNSIKSTGNGKSGYNSPALPASYSTYLGNPYAYGPYGRLNALPYTLPSTYASLLSNPAYAAALLGYPSPYVGRSVYPGYVTSLGYRYLPEAVRSGPAPVVAIAPRAAPVVPAPVPAPVPAIPAEPIVLPYRAALRAVRGKDGVVRYTFAPDGQLY